MWSLGDIYDIVKEGVPLANTNDMKIGTYHNTMPSITQNAIPVNYEDYIDVTVSFIINLPMEKIRDVTMMHTGDFTPLWSQLFHPELTKDGNLIYPNSPEGPTHMIEIIKGKVKLHVTLQLKGDRIAQTAKTIRDSNFYSLLEAAISD